MADDNLNQRDAKLVQWLSEAHVKEAELEADLTAHISLTQKASYKKRLRAHLTETKDHKKRVAARIKKLGGGTPSAGPSIPGVPDALGEVAGKAVAAVKGQVGVGRAAITSQPETHLRNAQEELREEHVEIAIYSRLETLANEVGDKDTAQLARAIRRDEERMAKFLNAELTRLVKEVVRAEIPRDQRSTGTRRKSSRSRSAASSSRRTSASTKRASGSSARKGTAASSRSTGSSARKSTAGSARSTGTSGRKSSGGARGRRSGGSGSSS